MQSDLLVNIFPEAMGMARRKGKENRQGYGFRPSPAECNSVLATGALECVRCAHPKVVASTGKGAERSFHPVICEGLPRGSKLPGISPFFVSTEKSPLFSPEYSSKKSQGHRPLEAKSKTIKRIQGDLSGALTISTTG